MEPHVLTIAFDELLRYSDEERQKWRRFFVEHPDAVSLPVQPGGRHATIGKLIDHIFLVERRHLQRLRGETVVDSTGLTGNNAPPLFDYGASVRRELETYARQLDDDAATQVRTIEVRGQQWQMTPRKLLFHILLHEVRHFAQIALAVRSAGLAPPGDHDLFFCRGVQ